MLLGSSLVLCLSGVAEEPIPVCQRILHIMAHIVAFPSEPAAKSVCASTACSKTTRYASGGPKGSENSASETPENQVVQSSEKGAPKDFLLGILSAITIR